MSVSQRTISSPIGALTLRASDHSLLAIEFGGSEGTESESHAILDETEKQLEEYFSGSRRSFDLPLGPEGSEFQLKVWTLLMEVPHGKTISYTTLSARYGDPLAIRAVAAANGKNPIPIIIPCHRVIGADGSLTGYAGGLLIKEQLLKLEGAIATQMQIFA